eukprot:198413_1
MSQLNSFKYNKKPYNSFRRYNSRRNYLQQQTRYFSQNDDYKNNSTHSKWIKKSELQTNNSKDKQYYRNKVWNYMENNNIALFPRPVYHRIPNFVGADKTSAQLMKLECFLNAKIVKVNPDKPQQNVRYLCLKMNKRLLIPTPRLNNYGLLNEIIIPMHLKNNNKTLEIAATRKGLQQFGYLLGLNQLLKWNKNNKIDICIVGSVAVDKINGYRIGKGEGYADIEIAIMNELGLIDKNTKFIATVHDCQVFEGLDSKLFDIEDVKLDYIVTPTQIIKIDKKKDKLLYKINWNKLSQKQLNNMPILKQLKNKRKQYNTDAVKRW